MPTGLTPGSAAPGERANAPLKYWRILHKSPGQSTPHRTSEHYVTADDGTRLTVRWYVKEGAAMSPGSWPAYVSSRYGFSAPAMSPARRSAAMSTMN